MPVLLYTVLSEIKTPEEKKKMESQSSSVATSAGVSEKKQTPTTTSRGKPKRRRGQRQQHLQGRRKSSRLAMQAAALTSVRNSKNPEKSMLMNTAAAGSGEPFIQIQVYPPESGEPQMVFLDTSKQEILYGSPIQQQGSAASNLSTVWIMNGSCEFGFGQDGPCTISNVTTPIGQAQTSQYPTAANTYDINVGPVSTTADFVWHTEFNSGKYALYYEQPSGQRLYALPVKDPTLLPPRDTLIKAKLVDPNAEDVFVFIFENVDSIKYNPHLPRGIDMYLRSQN